MIEHKAFSVPLGENVLALGPHPLVMGILNATPDSFSDGGDNFDLGAAIASAKLMRDQGADLLDIGGESTRPDAEPVSTQTELDRVLPLIEALILEGIRLPISIDTTKTIVADQAIQLGAQIINDVTGLQGEPELADVAALYQTPVIAMHWDKNRDTNADIVGEMKRYFDRTISIAAKAGLGQNNIILDPGFGFAKSFAENYQILQRLNELTDMGSPILVGMSRKSMLGKLLDNEPKQRLAGTIATSVIAYNQGAHIFRVHDVRENRQALQVATATRYGPPILEE